MYYVYVTFVHLYTRVGCGCVYVCECSYFCIIYALCTYVYMYLCVCVMLDCIYVCVCVNKFVYIRGVTGGTDQTSGGCSLCYTIPI